MHFTKFRIPKQNSMQSNLSGRMDDQLLVTMDTEVRGQIKRETFFSLYPFCSILIFKIYVSIICLDTER